MNENEKTLSGFTGALASRAPVPGGGGASALCGALGAALASMTANLTVGKAAYAQYDSRLRDILSRAETLQQRLLTLIGEDAAAFLPLSKAYAVPKDDPARAETLERCLRAAAEPPMAIAECACQAIELHRELLTCGSRLMQSDVGTGAALCRAALYGAAMNVRVNTRSMTDRAYADTLERRISELLDTYGKAADEIYETVWEKLK